MPRYSTRSRSAGTARWMDLRYPGTCTAGEALPAGTRAFYDPRDRSVTCTNLTHAGAQGLTRTKWHGSPVSGSWGEELSEHRIESFVGEYKPKAPRRYDGRRSGPSQYRSTSRGRCEDAPCCGCCS